MKIAVTGADGLFGWHLRCFFRTLPGITTTSINRVTFKDPKAMKAALHNADAVIHLAGMNRGDDTELYSTNVGLTEQLIAALADLNQNPHILFANSTHVDRETSYGRSKKESAAKLDQWAKKNGASFSNIIFPHLFGEHGKPFYNSVVSTFSYQIANGEKPAIHQDSAIEPLHLSDASKIIFKLIEEKYTGTIRIPGRAIRLTELFETLSILDAAYKKGIFPALKDEFTEHLFNTYRSYLYPSFYPRKMELRTDPRGSLFEAIKTLHLGQGFVSTTKPGISRGNHFHLKKVERFCVIKGEATIEIRKLFSREVQTFQVNGDEPSIVDIPTLHTHNITNVGSTDLITLFWSGEIFDAANPDTYAEPVTTPRPEAELTL